MNVPHFQQERDYSCLPACVRMVLAFYGEQHSEEELRRILKTRVTGTSPANLMLNLPGIGYSARVFDSSYAFLQSCISDDMPCIVHLWTPSLPHWHDAAIHAVVVTGIEDDVVLINDPVLSTPATPVLVEDFLEAWTATDHTLVLVLPRAD